MEIKRVEKLGIGNTEWCVAYADHSVWVEDAEGNGISCTFPTIESGYKTANFVAEAPSMYEALRKLYILASSAGLQTYAASKEALSVLEKVGGVNE